MRPSLDTPSPAAEWIAVEAVLQMMALHVPCAVLRVDIFFDGILGG